MIWQLIWYRRTKLDIILKTSLVFGIFLKMYYFGSKLLWSPTMCLHFDPSHVFWPMFLAHVFWPTLILLNHICHHLNSSNTGWMSSIFQGWWRASIEGIALKWALESVKEIAIYVGASPIIHVTTEVAASYMTPHFLSLFLIFLMGLVMNRI